MVTKYCGKVSDDECTKLVNSGAIQTGLNELVGILSR
jgi:hypothetical protein